MEPDSLTRSSAVGANDNLTCPQCGAVSVTTYRHYDTFNYGSGDSSVTLHADLPVRRCAACGFEFLDQEGERLRHEAVCQHLGVLSPAEVRGIRKRYGMSRATFAQVTGLGEATLGRWENGVVIQNQANDRYLRLLAIPEVMRRLRDVLATEPAPSQAPGFSKFRQFRVLDVSEPQRRPQASFRLRRAS